LGKDKHMAILGIIPARYASSRFPGKPLALINGKSMLQRVYEQSKAARYLQDLLVATDDERIATHARDFGARVLMTGGHHLSGTDRCHEAYSLNGTTYDYVINIQGDEPFIDPEQIDSLAGACDGSVEIVTQMIRCKNHSELSDAGEVKIVLNSSSEALYFSRNIIPFQKNMPEKDWHLHFNYYRHVGMYAYRSDVLNKIAMLQPSELEKAESLEQLRWLENGYRIKCIETRFESHCIDTPEDIDRVLNLMKSI
jgi:3-deoxy-manno-octulosonate cytidylyltransferase (CMP-KDO synthetase)